MRLFAIVILLLLPLGACWAQGDIHRCMGANGVPVFTDRVCSDVNASPVMPAPAMSAPVRADLSQPPAVLCAADMKQLKQAVIDAFAVRNPNRLAGLMLWNGDGQSTVVSDIRLFTRLMAHPLIDVKIESSSAGGSNDDGDPSELAMTASSTPPVAHGQVLRVQTESDDGSGVTEETRFDVTHQSGCLWLHPSG